MCHTRFLLLNYLSFDLTYCAPEIIVFLLIRSHLSYFGLSKFNESITLTTADLVFDRTAHIEEGEKMSDNLEATTADELQHSSGKTASNYLVEFIVYALKANKETLDAN
uniref:Uncharacterized protein n=1 Tax=Glossina palpalis gambiensis TaxID=67801 RepID=A0A1B0ARM0_9MUSC